MRRLLAPALAAALIAAPAAAGSQVDRRPGSAPWNRPGATPRAVHAAPRPLAGSIGAPFSISTVALCDGGPAQTNSIAVYSIGGYTGTPTVVFTTIPPGIVITPSIIHAAPMPPDQLLSFTVASAGAAEGVQLVEAHVTDTANGIDVTSSFNVNVTAPVLRPQASPTTVSLTAGGPAVAVTLSAAGPYDCYTGPIDAAITGLPAGVTATPATAQMAAPAYAPVTISLQAAPGAPSGTATATATYTTSWAPVHTVPIAITVAGSAPAPDFTLAVPASLSIPAGGSTSATVSIAGANGFAGSVDVVAQPPAGITVTPTTFSVAAGGSQGVQVQVAPGTPAGSVFDVPFRGTAAGVASPKTATLKVTVTNAPDFALAITPPALRGPAGSAPAFVALLTPLFGFAGTATLSVSGLPPGASLSPAAPALSPGAPVPASVLLSQGTPVGTFPLVFTATSGTVQRTAAATLEVLPSQALFTAIASPAAVLLSPGNPAAVSYTLTNLGDAPLTVASATLSLRTRDGALLDTREESVSLPLPPHGRVTYSATVSARDADFAAAGSPPILVFDRVFRSAPGAAGAVATAAVSVSGTGANSLVGTASVTRVSLLYPLSGTIVGRGDALRGQALLLGTGSGPVVVGWFFDGLLVETSTVLLTNGTPAAVRTSVGFPTTVEGTHEISLGVLSPNPIASPRVAVVVESGASALRLVSPAAGSAFVPGLAAPTFAWIPLPGIARYQVGLRRAGEPEAARRWFDAGASGRFGLSARQIADLPEGEWEWIVRGSTGVDDAGLSAVAGASVRPATTSDGGFTVASTTGHFSIGKLPASPVPLGGAAEEAGGRTRLSWQPVPNARYVVIRYDAAGSRLDATLAKESSATVAADPRAARWRAVAFDSGGGPLAWTDLLDLRAGGAR